MTLVKQIAENAATCRLVFSAYVGNGPITTLLLSFDRMELQRVVKILQMELDTFRFVAERLNGNRLARPDEYVNDRINSPNRFELIIKFVRFAARTRHEISQPVSK